MANIFSFKRNLIVKTQGNQLLGRKPLMLTIAVKNRALGLEFIGLGVFFEPARSFDLACGLSKR